MSEQLTPNAVEKALRRAFSLGQKYWQEADSEYVQHNIKSALTQQAFEALVAGTVEQARASQPALAQGDDLFARRLQQLRDYAQWEKDNSPTDKQHILDWAVAALSAQREQPQK